MCKHADNPYVGPRTFTKAQSHLFFGREREANALFARVLSERLVLFYAQSGAGKSSLINARLIPRLREAGYAVLPVARVSGALLDTDLTEVDNIYLFNLMLNLDVSSWAPARFARMHLDHFLAGLNSDDGRHYWYEEPVAPAQHTEPLSPSTIPYVLIVDQFEEIFTHYPDRWKDRENFFQQFNQAIAGDPLLRVLLVLREEYVAALDPYAPLLDDRLRARFYMQCMGPEAALQAIEKPAAKYDRPFAPGVAQALVQNLRQVRVYGQTEAGTGQFVEPVQLQVVCYQLWENVQARPASEITLNDLPRGYVDQALANFYEDAVRQVVERVRIHEGQVRDWFERRLITEGSTRAIVFQGMDTGSLPNTAADLLVDLHLLHTETRAGGRWVELAHDRLIEPIRASNKVWREAHLSILQRQAALWESEGRPSGLLLRDQALAEAEEWTAVHKNELTDIERDFLEACRKVQYDALREHTQNLRIRWLAVAATIALIVALYFGIRAIDARNLATSRELAAKAEGTLGSDPELSILLAMQALSKAPTSEADNALRQALHTSRLERTLANHGAAVNSVAFSPDGTRLLTADENGVAIVWDVISGEKLFAIEAGDAITSVAYSPDGTRLVTVGGTVIVWDVISAQRLFTISHHEGAVNNVAFSPDGTRLATTGADGTVIVWDATSGQELLDFNGNDFLVNDVTFSPDGARLAAAGNDGNVKVWDITSKETLRSFVYSEAPVGVFGVAFSPDGRWLAAAGGLADEYKTRGKVWSMSDDASDQPVFVLVDHTDDIFTIAYSPDGTRLATASTDGTAILWDASTGRALFRYSGHKDWVRDVAFSPDGERLATASWDGTARVWATAPPFAISAHTQQVNDLAYSPDGTRLATASQDRTMVVWDSNSEEALFVVQVGGPALALTFSPDSRYVATAITYNYYGGGVEIWDIVSQSRIATLPIPSPDFPADVAFSPDGTQLAAVSYYGHVPIWDVASAERALTLDDTDQVYAVAYSPDGKHIATAGGNGTVIVWDIASGEPSLLLIGHTASVFDVAYSPDGTSIATASWNKTATIWNAQSGQPLQTLIGHTDRVFKATFNSDGTLLATASADETTRVWDIDSGEELLTLSAQDGEVYGVAFSPDGTRLATAGQNGMVYLYILDIEELLDLARERVTRSLTLEECNKYLHRKECPPMP